MFAQKTIWILALSIAITAIGSLVFVGSGLSGFAQIYDDSTAQTTDESADATDETVDATDETAQTTADDTAEVTDVEETADIGLSESWSGNVDSLIVDENNAQFILGGEWTLSIEDDIVTDFSADIDMAPADGNVTAHTHRIVLAEETTETAAGGAAESGEVQVTLVPVQQDVGGSVLINATGLSDTDDITVTVGNDIVAGTTEPDENGTVLYALGITEEMIGTVEVNVEGENGDTGSASLTVTEAIEEENATSTIGNETGSTGQLPTNATEATGNTTAQSGLGAAGDVLGSTTGAEGVTNGLGNNTTESETTAPTAGLLNAIEGTSNDTSTVPGNLSGTVGIEETPSSGLTDRGVTAVTDGSTTTFTATADIYTGGELAWEDVEITVSVINGETSEIQIDSEATEGHFGAEPIVGVVQSDGSASLVE